MSADEPLSASTPRGRDGRAPDPLRVGGWTPMRMYRDDDAVDFVIVGTGAGGGTLACRLAEHGFSVVALDAGAWWRPLEEFASDESHQRKLFWTDERICDGADPLTLGTNNSGRAVGGSTVHFAMVSLRFRPEWFRSRTALGYGVDWPLDWREMWRYYREVEQALKISGPVRYPWGPPRPRYPYRAHELNAAALVLARGADALGIGWSPTPLATLSAPRGRAHPCVYRGFCIAGCATNAKQSALVTWIPRAVAAGAEVRDLAMALRIDAHGDRVTGRALRARRPHALSARAQRRRRRLRGRDAAAVAAVRERPSSAGAREQFRPRRPLPDGAAEPGVVGDDGRRSALVQGTAVASLTNTELRRRRKIIRGYCWMRQGPHRSSRRENRRGGLWGDALKREMARYNFQAGLKMVGETLPRADNRVTLADERDAHGLPVARVTYAYDDNDRRMIRHALAQMGRALEAAGARDIWHEEDDTCHLAGTARMGDDPATSVVDADCRSWDIPNLWICDGSVFPTVGGVNPSLTIQAIACRTADRIRALVARGDAHARARR
ncbi:Choline dehydrogenase [Burkholderia dolosa AU0158]|nr:Choline dehydrogenase [Burkholderia dolosa AU0158]